MALAEFQIHDQHTTELIRVNPQIGQYDAIAARHLRANQIAVTKLTDHILQIGDEDVILLDGEVNGHHQFAR